MLARRWHCRPSEADEEPAIWVLRQRLVDHHERTFAALNTATFNDD